MTMWEKLKDNLASLIAVAVFAWIAGNVQGTTPVSEMANDIKGIKAALNELKASESNHDRFVNCTAIRLELLEKGVKSPPDCVGKD